MILSELGEDGDGRLAQAVAPVAVGFRLDGGHDRLQRCLVVAGAERLQGALELACLLELLDQPIRARGPGQAVEERGHGRGRLGADELGHDVPVAEGLHGRDPAHAEPGGEAGVGVDVDLGQLDPALARCHRLLQQGSEHVAGAAPLGPEVDDDRHLARALDDVLLEARLADVHGVHGSRL